MAEDNKLPYSLYNNDYNLSSSTLPKELDLILERPTLFPSESTPVQLDVPKTKSPGFIKSAIHGFAENEEILAGANYLYEHSNEFNPFADDKPNDWTPYETKNYIGISEKYWPLIGTAHTPKELDIIHSDIMNKMQKDEEYQNGSLAGQIIGAGLGILASPSSMIPMSGVLKYGKSSEYVLKNMMRMAPGMTAQAAAHNVFMESMEANPSMANAAVNTMRDAVFGTAIAGIGLTIRSAREANRLWSARKTMNYVHEGITPHFELNAEGKRTGRIIAVPEKGSTISAKEVDFAQEYFDSTIAKEGLFAIPKIEKVIGLASPLVRGLTNRFPNAKLFLSRVSDHSFITEGMVGGKARPDNFSEKVSLYRSETNAFLNQMKGLWHESNGITPGGSQGIKALQQRFNKQRTYEYSDFSKRVINTLIRNEPSESKSINEAAALLKGHLEKTYKRFREAHGIDEKWMSPRTAYNYFMRSYDQNALVVREDEWNQVISTEYKKQDELITQKNTPINDANAQIKNLKSSRAALKKNKANKAEISRINRDIKFAENQRKAYEAILQDEILENPDLFILAEDPTHLSYTESETLTELHKQKVAHESQITKLKEELKKLGKAEADKVKKKEIDDEMRVIEKLLSDEIDRLHELAYSKKISRRLYNKNHKEGTIEFKDPALKLKLRELFKDDDARLAMATKTRQKILNQLPDDLNERVLGSLTKSQPETNASKRTHMVKDTVLHDNNFLHNDINELVHSYDSFMNKRTALKQIYASTSIEGGIEPLIQGVYKDYEMQKAQIFEISDLKLRKKELAKAKKDLDSTIEDMKATYDVMMGRTGGSEKARRFSKGAVNYTAASRLGAVPLTMIVEPMAMIMQHGLWPSIHSGLVPAMKSLGGIIKNRSGKELNESAGQALLAIQHLNSHAMAKMTNPEGIRTFPEAGVVSGLLEKVANTTSSITGVHRLDNLLQKMTANVVQGDVIRLLKKFEDGIIKKNELNKLLHLGIQPEKWSKRFIKGWEETGADSNGLGGYNSNYFNWADTEASNKMTQAIRRGVRSTILSRDITTAPLWTNHPVYGLLTLFKGWGFEALNRYTLPTMQRPEGQKLFGMALMLGMGSLVSPLRRLARGESPFEEDATSDQIFWEALVNSGVLGVTTDLAEDLNVLMQGNLLGKFQSDKYKGRSVMGMLGGPLGQIGEDLSRVIGMIAGNNYNENDIKKAARLFPYANVWEMRALVNKSIEGMNLPKTAHEAELMK